MFTIDAARSLGYRDSFLFYAKNKELPKLLAREEDKDHLVELGFLIPQLKTRNINLIPARQLFKKFGHRCIKRGIPVRDDYFVGDKPEPDENEYWESWGQEQEEEEEGEQPLGERGTVPSWRNALRKTEGIVKDLIDGNQAGLGGAQLEKEADQIPQAARNRMARMVVAGSESNDRITQERLQRSVHQFEVNTRQPVFPTVYTANVHVRWEMERGSNVDPGRKINIEVVPVEQDDDPRWMPLEPTEESIKYPLAVDAGQYQANFSIFTHRFGREHEPVVMPSTLGFIPKSIGGPGPQMQPYQQPPGPYGPPYPGMQMQPTPGGPMTPAMIAAQQRNAQPHYSFFCGFKTNHGMPCKRPVTRNGERCLYHRSEQGGVAPSLGPSPRPPLPGGVKPEGTPAAPSPVPPPVAESSFPPVKRGPGRPPKHPKPNPVCEECETESTPARLEKDTSQDPMPNLMLRCAIDKLHFHAYCAEVGTPPMIAKVVTYPWECSECKLCCVCKEAGDDENLLLCDACDRGYHLGCLVPKPDSLPEGSWLCPLCAVCHTCGRKSEQKPAKGELAEMLAARTQRTPQADVEAANVASEFQHAVVPTPAHLVPRNGSNTYTATYCSGCFPDWEGDRFCPVCLVTYAADQDDVKMVQCDKCDRWVHTQCDPGMDDVRYKKLMDAGDSAKYTCPCCSPGDAWRLTKVAREGKRPIEYKGFVILA
ncbi:chromatin remodelling complex Rsc7/Swp82 subunit-domain-containing protein [Hyaloraphidium curvatum]|nr:chromatin remodelling complex Rsc7/Swp82 subunit-domain-containing protein [Hyaloraphidium curvatum]